MLVRVVAIGLWSATAVISGAQAQTIVQIGGPAEVPPATYAGDQFVDSRGCVFLRAGYGGNVTWVPRVTAERKPLCGYSPTPAAELAPPAPAPQEVRVAEVGAGMPSPAPEPTVVPSPVGAPMETVATLTTPPKVTAPAAATPPTPGKYLPAPVARPAAAVATPRKTKAATAPRKAAPARAATTATEGTQVAPRGALPQGLLLLPGQIACYASAPVPRKFRTAQGESVTLCTRGDGSMAGLRLPIYPHGAAPAPVKRAAAVAPPVTAAPASAPAAASDRIFVQVGSFAVPANAEATKTRIRAAGMRVGTAQIVKRGQPLEMVFAGPFATAGEAQGALARLRAAGYADAYIP